MTLPPQDFKSVRLHSSSKTAEYKQCTACTTAASNAQLAACTILKVDIYINIFTGVGGEKELLELQH